MGRQEPRARARMDACLFPYLTKQKGVGELTYSFPKGQPIASEDFKGDVAFVDLFQ